MCEAQVEGSRIGISVAPNTTHASRSYYQSSYFQEDKRYSVQVICSAIATGEEVMVETAFEVDTSPPRLPTITLSKNSTCPADGNYILSAGFSAADNRSGIDKYLYGISSSTLGTADIVNLTETSDSRATIPRLNLSSKLAVYWVIEAVDKVGNIGPRESANRSLLRADVQSFRPVLMGSRTVMRQMWMLEGQSVLLVV